MGRKDIDRKALREVVTSMRSSFHTKDVSEHPVMRQAHDRLVGTRNYHADVGGALSNERLNLGIELAGTGHARGALWLKGSATKAGTVSFRSSFDVGAMTPSRVVRGASPDERNTREGIGPQYRGDGPFRARMRFHQSWYRSEILGLPYGTGPRPTSATYYGNMLDEEGAEAGGNFLSPRTFALARRRVAEAHGAVEPFRLFRNLLSSQPMCFNMFGPLVGNTELATRLMRSILPNEVERVTDVRIEYSPQPIGEYLNDRTAFDAFVEFTRPGGTTGFLGVETKLTEPFSRQAYDSDVYRRLTERPESPWLPEAWSMLADAEWNQLWRNHLLVEAAASHAAAPHGTTGHLMLVRHPHDHECSAVVTTYGRFLRDDARFLDFTLDALVDRWSAVVKGEAERGWLDAFRLRYLDLDCSEPA